MEVTSRRVLISFLAIFLVLELWVGYWSVIRGPELETHARNPGAWKRRHVSLGEGSMIATAKPWSRVSGRTTATKDVSADPLSLSQTIGYYHPRFGTSGLERTYDTDLRGSVLSLGLFSRDAAREGLIS